MATTTTTDFSAILSSHLSGEATLPSGIAALKREAMEQFKSMGLPSMKHEEWKYTFLQKYLKKGFQFEGAQQAASGLELSQLPVIASDRIRIVMVDGKCEPSLSQIPAANGIFIECLAKTLREDHVLATELFGTLAHNSKQALSALNLALCTDGLVLHAAAGANVQIDLLLVHTDAGNVAQLHHLIKLEEGAKVFITEQHLQISEGSFTNMVSEVHLAEQARLEWVKIQDAGSEFHLLDSTYAQVESKAEFKSVIASLTGALLRNSQYIKINGQEANADLNGVYVLDQEQQADNIIVIQHQKPESTSNQLFKGILDGQSTGTFNGKIIVDQDAQKTNAFQSNKNILVSDEAAAYFRPQLEIFADDVKCSHGATSAEIEDSELFYLRARGIGKDTARALLMLAFAGDVLETIGEESVKAQVLKSIERKLKLEY